MKPKILNFGFKDEYMHMFGINNIGSVFYINQREQFAVTPKELIKFERDQILKRFCFHFSIGCYIDKYDMVAFITEYNFNLCIFSVKDMTRPIVSNYPLNQTGIFHILYSSRSNCLITVGTGVKVWKLNIDNQYQSSISQPTININLRSYFAYDKYETMILNPPSFDYSRELIFLPTSQGIKGFNLDGHPETTMTRLPAKNTTPISYCQTNGKLLASDPLEGVCLWDKNGKIKSTYTVCSSSIIWLSFITQEHALVMNCHGAIFILNLKTGRTYHIYTSPMIPNRLILQSSSSEIDPILVFIFNSRAVYKRIVIPWTLWAKNVILPKQIRRVNKINEAARVLVQTSNSFVKFFSPKNGAPLTSASPKTSATPVSVMYDRGTFTWSEKVEGSNDKKQLKICETEKRDELFIAMDDGVIYGFDTGFLPCKEALQIDLKSMLITTCFEQEETAVRWMYAVVSPKGEVFFCDYNSLRSSTKVMVGNYDACALFFHARTRCLVLLFKNEVVLLDVKKRSVVSRLKLSVKEISVSQLNEDCLYIGLVTGQIVIVEIIDQENLVVINDLATQIIHSESVTSFAFAPSFWVSAGKDGTVLFWEYSLDSIAKISLPEPIYACEVINGRRDLVVGTKSELMMIEGEIVFDGEIDDEIEVIDNFDKKEDQLYSQIFTLAEEEEDIEESLLSQRKNAANKQKKRRKLPSMPQNQNNFENIEIDENDDEKEALRKESAVAGMMKINEDRKVSVQPSVAQEETSQTEEEDENEDSETVEDDEGEEGKGEMKKKRRKVKKKGEVKSEQIKSDVDDACKKEKEDFLNDLFPKKKVLPPEQPMIPFRARRGRDEAPKMRGTSRPDRRRRRVHHKDEEEANKAKSTEEEASSNEQQIEKREEEEKVTVISDDEQKMANIADEDEKVALIQQEGSGEVKESEQIEKDDNNVSIKAAEREDVATQGDACFEEEEDINGEKVESLQKDNKKKEKQAKDDVFEQKQKKEKDSKKEKAFVADKNPIKLKETDKQSKHPLKDETASKETSKTSPSKSNSKDKKAKTKENLTQNNKMPHTPPPQAQISPRKRPQPPVSIENSKSSFSKSPTFSSESKNEKEVKITEIDSSSRLLMPIDDERMQEEGRKQIERNTKLYLCNLPQSNNPLSIVTNIDDPMWHANDDKKCMLNENGKANRLCQIKENENVKLFQINEEYEVVDAFEEDAENDRLAEAVGKRCPGLIFTNAPKISSSSSAVLNLGKAIVPGAAWMRRTTVGSRLIKSTRPKVVAPIGKIEKSINIRASGSDSRVFFRTPLEKIRLKGKLNRH